LALKVIGAGLGRTGTLSLKAALEELGFTRCYHMIELFHDPARVVHWENAAAGRPVDWDALFDGYQAAVDYPACQYYRQLLEHYPDAKVVLTVRDPHRWYESANETIFQSARSRTEPGEGGPPRMPFPHDSPYFIRVIQLIQGSIFGGHFQGKTDDPAFCMEVFRRHNDEVQQVVPPDQLLVYEVKQGWEPLCRFLGVPVPESRPFPHLNEREDFRRMLRGEGPGPLAGLEGRRQAT
jgi:Sulfotransferase domain